MKKFASLLLTVVLLAAMLTGFAVPASAEDEPTEVTPMVNQFGSKYIKIENEGNYIITEDCEIDSLEIGSVHTEGMNCTLTIAPGVHITATYSVVTNATFIIEAGATVVMVYDIQNKGIINVYGTLNFGDKCYNWSTMNVYGTVNLSDIGFQNCDTINVHGTLDGSKSRLNMCCNMSDATINIYTDGTFKGIENSKNSGTINENLECHETHICDHTFGDDNICTKCQRKGCYFGVHLWKGGKCTVCQTECKNAFHNGVYKCPVCDMGYDATVTGSILSEGSLTIIVGVAAAVVFGLGGFFLGTKKKKKPALADGESKDEE